MERFMMLFVAVNVVMIPLVLHAHVATHSLFRDSPYRHSGRHVLGGRVAHHLDHRHDRRAVQLYFQQSTSSTRRFARWLNYERIDTILVPSSW